MEQTRPERWHDDLKNEDWLKTLSWDLGSWDDLLAYLGVTTGTPDEQRAALADFMSLPAWTAAPPEIKRAAASHGVGGAL